MLLLLEIQSEPKLQRLLRSLGTEHEAKLLRHAIAGSLAAMMSAFRQKCIQHAPHINYMQPTPLARVSCALLMSRVASTEATKCRNPPTGEQLDVARAVGALMACIRNAEQTALIYIDARLMEKFVVEHLLRREHLPQLLAYLGWLAGAAKQILAMPTRQESEQDALGVLLATVNTLLQQPRVWRELNASSDPSLRCELLDLLDSVARCILQDTIFYRRHRPDRNNAKGPAPQAIFLAKLIETQIEIESLASGRVLAGVEDARLQFAGQDLARFQVALVSDNRLVICQYDPGALSIFSIRFSSLPPVAGHLYRHLAAANAPVLCLRGHTPRAHPAARRPTAGATGRWQAALHSCGQPERCGCPPSICQEVSVSPDEI